VIMIGAVGDDDAGRWCAGALFDAGIEARLDIVGPQPTGLSLTARDPHGQTSTVVVPGANASLGVVGENLLADAAPGDVVLIHLDIPLDTVAAVAHDAARLGARVVLNASPYAALPAEAAALAEPLVVGEREAAMLADGGLIPESLCVTFAGAGAVWDGLRVDGSAVTGIPLPATPEQLDAFSGTLAAALAADLDRPAALHHAVASSTYA
jgi:ribokinase